MNKLKITVAALALCAAVPFAMAQDNRGTSGGAAGGAAAGAIGGAIVGGPVGAVVGGAAGAITGAAFGSMAEPDREYVTTYVRENERPSVRIDRQVSVGTVLPEEVTLYEVEGRDRVRGYHYTYVNDRPVLVDRKSRRIVHVIR